MPPKEAMHPAGGLRRWQTLLFLMFQHRWVVVRNTASMTLRCWLLPRPFVAAMEDGAELKPCGRCNLVGVSNRQALTCVLVSMPCSASQHEDFD
jgi:hypothetical protein